MRTRPRSALALTLSIAAHLVLLYALSRYPWPTAPPIGHRAPIEAVWLDRWPASAPSSPAVEPAEEPKAPASRTPEAPLEATTSEITPAPDREQNPSPPEPRARESRSSNAPAAHDSSERGPRIDWEEERRRAVAKVLEQRERENDYVTFSLDDLVESPRPEIEPITPAMSAPKDDCVIATGKMKRMAMMMIGRCVRAPRADMFANLMPDYLRKRPLCHEVSVAPRLAGGDPGRELVEIKCRLVDENEMLAARSETTEPNRLAALPPD